MLMLNDFVRWAHFITTNRTGPIVQAKVTVSPESSNKSARLDIDTSDAIARITCWENGYYIAEIIDIETEKQTYVYHGILQDSLPLSQQFRQFFDALGVIAN
jgi:hypothetical protein